MRRAHAPAVLLLGLLATASPALADPTLGTYRSEGTHSTLGAFTGEVTLERGVAGAYALRGRERFSGGRELTWTGSGRLSGNQLNVTITYETPGLAGALDPNHARRQARGTYMVGQDGRLVRGSWRASKSPRHRVRETLRLGAATPTPTDPTTPPGASATIDLQALRDGQPIPESAEETEGAVVAANIDDDDHDGGSGADGQNRIVGDANDPDGTANEDDLLEVRVGAPTGAPANATVRVVHGAGIAVWRGKTRTGRVASGADLPSGATTLFVEGLAATTPGRGESLAVEVVANGQVIGRDAVTVHVAGSAFLLIGHGCTGSWYVNGQCRERALDRRTNPTLVKGKAADGTPAYWAVYVWESEKEAKIALSTPGAVISYDGHSNFGMGFAFDTGFSKLSEFMNIADPQIPVNWIYMREHQSHPRLLFSEAEYADDASTQAKFDPIGASAQVPTSRGPMRKSRWPLSGGDGQRFPLTRGDGDRWHDHHYGEGENIRIVVKAGSRDMPEKRWAKLFLNSCYSGGYYYDSFGGHGTLFFTTDESSSTQSSGAFMFGFIDGKSDDAVLAEINTFEDINSYRDFGAP